MSIEEQQLVKKEFYSEAIRYMENAKENLQKAKKRVIFIMTQNMSKWHVQ